MSDLYWDRICAGHYETGFFRNKYRYKIIGEGIEWEAFYMYYTKDISKRVWRKLPHTYTIDRLKEAKRKCEIHNNHPRRKFMIEKREKLRFKDKEGITFVEIYFDREKKQWLPRPHGQYHMELPEFYESYSSKITYLGEEYYLDKVRFTDLEEDEKQRLIDAS